MTPLKPCPFCGSRDIGLEGEWATRYQCNDCGALSPQCATRDSEGAKAYKWNTRVSWHSLKGEPPGNDNRLILLRGRPEPSGAEQSGIVVNIPGWDGTVYRIARANLLELMDRRYKEFTEYMELPE